MEIIILGRTIKLKVHDESELTSNLLRYGSVDTDMFSAYEEILKEGDTYLDIGANMGVNAIFGSLLVGNTGTVYAFEPEEKNYNLLLENIALNNIKNIIPINAAVSDETSVAQLFKSTTNFGDHRVNQIMISTDDHSESVEIVCITLDQFIEEYNVDPTKISLIKSDTQGSEVRVLHGGKKFFNVYEPAVILEFAPHHLQWAGYSPFDILSFIDRMKYTACSMSYFKKLQHNCSVLTPLTYGDLFNSTVHCMTNGTHTDFCLIRHEI